MLQERVSDMVTRVTEGLDRGGSQALVGLYYKGFAENEPENWVYPDV